MKNRIWLIKILLLISTPAFADFGEIDLMVRDSIEDFFNYEGREVDLKTLNYDQEPKSSDGILKVHTTVQAIEGFTRDWALHSCTTHIEITAPGAYKDLGSDCSFDLDH